MHVFRKIFWTQTDYFPKTFNRLALWRRFLWGRYWTFKYRRYVKWISNSSSKDFRGFFSVLEQMLSWYTKSTLQLMPLTQPSQKLTSKFWPKLDLTNTIKISVYCYPPNTKLSPDAQLLSSDAYSQHTNSHHRTFFTSRRSTLLAVCLYQKDERALPWEPSERQTLLTSRFPVIISVVPLTAPPPHLYSVSLSLSLSHRWTSCLKGLIGLSFGVKYERLQFLLPTEEGDRDESGLTSREWLWKGGTWVFWKYSHCKLRFSVCYKSLLDTGKAFSKENKEIIC